MSKGRRMLRKYAERAAAHRAERDRIEKHYHYLREGLSILRGFGLRPEQRHYIDQLLRESAK